MNENINKGEIAAYSEFKTQIANLEQENSALAFDYADPKGNKEARSHIYKLRQSKSAIENARKTAKADALAYGKRVDAEASELKGRVDAMIDVHAKPIQEIEEREQARISALESKIHRIHEIGEIAERDWQTADLDKIHAELKSLWHGHEDWAEFDVAAETAHTESVNNLNLAMTRRTEWEAEQAELEALRKEKAERDAKDAAEKAKREQEEREKRIAEEAAARAKAELEERIEAEKRRAEQAEQEAKAAEERANKEKAEAEARGRQQAEDERKRAEEKEQKRKENKRHQTKITKEATESLAEAIKKYEGDAGGVISDIYMGNVKHISLNF